MAVKNQEITENYALYNGDCVEVLKEIKSESIGYSVFSPPFADLYTYSDSPEDMGNSKNYDEFFVHFSFLVPELYRVMEPGRNITFHCTDIPMMKERDGAIGLKDFPGDVLRCFQKAGFIYHSKHIIWKDPLIEVTRTKALGLLHRQVVKDSAMCRAGLPDYLITVRKPGENKKPLIHKTGFTEFIGENAPTVKGVKFSHLTWQKYASPVWMDIRQGRTLNKKNARAEKDEKHICPLQLDTIERAVELWSIEGDVVLSPFAGIGSEGFVAIQKNRKFIGVELKESYYDVAKNNLKNSDSESQRKLF